MNQQIELFPIEDFTHTKSDRPLMLEYFPDSGKVCSYEITPLSTRRKTPKQRKAIALLHSNDRPSA